MANYKDRHGRVLGLEAQVRLVDTYEEDSYNVGERTGKVVALPGADSEWYGFPRVAFHGATKASHYVPASMLELTEGQLSEADRHAATRTLVLALTDTLTARRYEMDAEGDLAPIVQMMAMLGFGAEAAMVLEGQTGMSIAESTGEVACHLAGDRGVWGYTGDHPVHGRQRYHLCARRFTEDGHETVCTDDFGHDEGHSA